MKASDLAEWCQFLKPILALQSLLQYLERRKPHNLSYDFR